MVPGDRSTKMNVIALVHKELPIYWRKEDFSKGTMQYIHVRNIQTVFCKKVKTNCIKESFREVLTI